MEINTDFLKVIFRKGKCLEQLGKFKEAYKEYRKFDKLEPGNKSVLKGLTRVQKHLDLEDMESSSSSSSEKPEKFNPQNLT